MELNSGTSCEVMVSDGSDIDLPSSSSEYFIDSDNEGDDSGSENNKDSQAQLQLIRYEENRGDGDSESAELTKYQEKYKIITDQYSTFCNFCTKRLPTEKDLINHLDDCMPSLKKIADIRKRQCLICCRRIPSFTVCGLIKESISCLIQQWETYIKTEKACEIQTDSPIREIYNTPADEKDDESVIEIVNYCTENVQRSNPSPPKANRQSGCFAKSPNNIIQKPFSQLQRAILKKHFRRKRFPSLEEIEQLAENTDLTFQQVSNWFGRMRNISSRRRRQQRYCESYLKSRPVSQTNKNRISLRCNGNSYSKRIIKLLLDSYCTNSHPDFAEKSRLVKETGLRLKQINNWFTNRRRSLKRNAAKELDREDLGFDCSPSPDQVHSDLITEEFDSHPRLFSSSTTKEKRLNNNQDAAKAQKLFELKYAAAASGYPSLKEIFEMVDETGVEVENLYAWFHKKRRVLYERRRQKRKRSVRKSSYFTWGSKKLAKLKTDDAKEMEKDECSTNEEDEMKPKELSIRQKFVQVKKVDKQNMNFHLLNSSSTLSRILTLKTGEWKSTLRVESARLEEANKIIQPFKEVQLEWIKSWDMELVRTMLKSPSGFELIIHGDLDWTMEVISIWHPVLVYSSILDVSVADAVKELYRSSLTRGEKNKEQNWEIPELIESVPEFALPIQFTAVYD